MEIQNLLSKNVIVDSLPESGLFIKNKNKAIKEWSQTQKKFNKFISYIRFEVNLLPM